MPRNSVPELPKRLELPASIPENAGSNPPDGFHPVMIESIPKPIDVPTPVGRRPAGRSFSARFSAALSRLLVRLRVDEVPHIKRIIVTVVGGTIIIFGFSLIWTPAPTGLLIPVGLAVLGTEYAWARRWMRKAQLMAGKALARTQKIMGGKDKAD